MDLNEGAIWLGDRPEPTLFSFGDLAPLMETFLQEDLPRILSGAARDAFWHLQYRCEWCEYYEHCRSQAERQRDISLVPGLTASDKAFLNGQLQSQGLADLATALNEPDAANATLRRSAGLRGRRTELSQRAQALLNKARLPTTAASPTMPKRQDIALHLVLVPDNVNRDVAMAGYLLAMGEQHAAAIFGQPSLALQVFFRDGAGLVRRLHADLMRVALWNAENPEWKDRVSVVPFVYSARERELLLKLLLDVLSDLAGPRNEALDILLLLLGSELVDVEETGDQPAHALPIVIMATEVTRLFAVPAAISPTFPEVIEALTSDSPYAFNYTRHDLFDFPLGLALRDEALHGRHGESGEGRVWLESRIKQRLWGMRALVWRIQGLAGDRLPSWPPKFSLWSPAQFRDPALAQLTFVTRYESVSDCEEVRAVRFQPLERLIEGDTAIRLMADQDGWFELASPEAAIGVTADSYTRHWLVSDTSEGRSASIALRDYHHGCCRRTKTGGLWMPSPRPNAAMHQVVVREVQPPFPASPRRVKLAPSEKKAPPIEALKGSRHFLFPAFQDWNTTRVVEALAAIDARDDSPVHRFLNDPAGFAESLPLSGAAQKEVAALTSKAFDTPGRMQIFDAVANHRMGVIIGPPGTGKTHTLAQLISCLATAHAKAQIPFRALITAFTHSAINELGGKLAELGGDAFDVKRVKSDGCMDGLTKRAEQTKRPVIVCATTFELLRSGNRDAAFDLIIVDEASQMRLPEAVLAIDRLTPAGRLVLCGDDQQLGPIFKGVYPERDEDDDRFDPATSVFSHALRALDRARPTRDHPARAALSLGRRMNDVLTSVPSVLLYGPELNVPFRPADETIAGRRLTFGPADPDLPALTPLVRAALDPAVPLVIIEVDEASPQRESATEAAIVAKIARSLCGRLPGCTSEAPPEEKGLFIVAPHHVQIAAIRRRLSKSFSVLPLVDTVEKMQGKTCEVVVVSYGVADADVAMAEDEFIYDRNRLNVALSRARSKAILIISKSLLDPPPRILDRERAVKGFSYLREIVDRAQDVERRFRVKVCGNWVGVRLLGMRKSLI